MKLPPHLIEIQNSTSFTAKEILDFQKKFINLCEPNSKKLKMEPFVKFMRMLGVKSNATLVGRMFNLMDSDVIGSISFSEFMKYFDILLNGDQEQKAELIFLIIAIGNEHNIGRASSKMFFKHNDLYQLLKIMRESEMKNLGESPDREDMEALKIISDNMMAMLNVKKGEKVTLDLFREAIKTNLNVLNQFQMIGEGLESLMSYQGENKYTRTVRALRLVRERYESVLGSFEDMNLGYEKTGIGTLIAQGIMLKHMSRRRSQRFPTKTFMDKFAKNIKKKSKFAKENEKNNKPVRLDLKPQNLKEVVKDTNTINLQSNTISPEFRPKRPNLNFSPLPESGDIRFSDINSIKKKDDDDSDPNISSEIKVDEYFKDETNIEFSQIDGIDKKNLKKANKVKFKNDEIMTLEDVRRMVNEIEEGVYAPKNQIIKLYNDEKEWKKLEEKNSNYGYNKKMPTFKKISRVPNPDSKIFEDFEKMLNNGIKRTKHKCNCGGNISTSNSRNNEEQEDSERFIEKVLKSKEYLNRKLNFLLIL